VQARVKQRSHGGKRTCWRLAMIGQRHEGVIKVSEHKLDHGRQLSSVGYSSVCEDSHRLQCFNIGSLKTSCQGNKRLHAGKSNTQPLTIGVSGYMLWLLALLQALSYHLV
jgi:hypothetical protein